MKYKMYINSRHNSSLLNLTLLPFPSRSLLFRFETSNLESLLIQMSENISWIYNISSLLVWRYARGSHAHNYQTKLT